MSQLRKGDQARALELDTIESVYKASAAAQPALR